MNCTQPVFLFTIAFFLPNATAPFPTNLKVALVPYTQLTISPAAIQNRRRHIITFGACRNSYHEEALVHLTILTVFLVVVNTLSRLILLAIFFTCRCILVAYKIARSQLGGPQGGLREGEVSWGRGGGGEMGRQLSHQLRNQMVWS